MFKNIVGFSAVALFIAVLTPACASSTQDSSDDSADELRAARCGGIAGIACKAGYDCNITATYPDAMGTCKKHVDFFSCESDDDCVAVPEAACCHSGRDAAISIHHTTAYSHSVTCPDHQVCPLFLIHETRVAQCGSADSGGKRSCEMIAPEKVRCGGFIAPAFQHKCERGYECNFSGHVPDVPGACKAIAN